MLELNYKVVLRGLEKIPLYTHRRGAIDIMKSFESGQKLGDLLIDAVDSGTKFANQYVEIENVNANGNSPAPAFEALKRKKPKAHQPIKRRRSMAKKKVLNCRKK